MTYKGRFTRTGNSKSYAFEAALFRRMLEAGSPPGDWDELLQQSEGLQLPSDSP